MNAADVRKKAQEVRDRRDAANAEKKAAAQKLAEDRYKEYKQTNHTAVHADIEGRIEKAASLGSEKAEITESYKGQDWDFRARLLEETALEFKKDGFTVDVRKQDEWSKRVTIVISWPE